MNRTWNTALAVTCDIDSTLADTTDRQGMIDPERRDETDWTAYAKACAGDQPTHVITLLDLLGESRRVVLITSRPEAARPETVAWLDLHGVTYDDLIMDDGADYGGPTQYKVAMVARVHADTPVALHIDDWYETNQAIWSSLAIPAVTVRVYGPDVAMTR